MKFTIVLAALMCSMTSGIQLQDDKKEFFFARQAGKGIEGERYERIPTMRFSGPGDDSFLHSMIMKYAAEEKVEKEVDGFKVGGVPSGNFFLNKASAELAAKEVLSSHKGLKGADLDAYMKTYFPRSWDHFDVNNTGFVEVMRIPSFMRFLASDQQM